MFASLQRTRHDSVHRPVRERPRNQRHARPGMNEHEHRHTAEGTRDDVKPNASREEHFLRDRKSTRLNSSTNAHLVCRLLLEKKKQNNTHEYVKFTRKAETRT